MEGILWFNFNYNQSWLWRRNFNVGPLFIDFILLIATITGCSRFLQMTFTYTLSWSSSSLFIRTHIIVFLFTCRFLHFVFPLSTSTFRCFTLILLFRRCVSKFFGSSTTSRLNAINISYRCFISITACCWRIN